MLCIFATELKKNVEIRMNTNSDDILLLKLIKQGDQIAFRHLFYQYADSLERFITLKSAT